MSDVQSQRHFKERGCEMSTDQNKTIVRRFYEEVFNRGNLALLGELVATDYIEHYPFSGQAPGSEGLKGVVTMFRAAFPEIRITVEDTVAEGNKVAVRRTMRGTQKGELMGIAPTGKEATWTAIDIFTVAGGKVQERWAVADALGMMQQLGVIPAPGQSGR